MAWVRVVGQQAASSDQLEASRILGRLLAEEGYGLITTGWPGVEYEVARLFVASLPGRGGSPERLRLRQVVAYGWQMTHEGAEVMRAGSEEEAFDTSIHLADLVVLVGGIGGVAEAAAKARRLGKPVFPMAATGGVARTVFEEMVREWDLRSIAPLRIEDFRTLDQPLTPDTANLRRLLRAILDPPRQTPSPQEKSAVVPARRVIVT